MTPQIPANKPGASTSGETGRAAGQWFPSGADNENPRRRPAASTARRCGKRQQTGQRLHRGRNGARPPRPARDIGPPWLAPSFAAKAGMDSLAVSYAGELARWGIETSIIVPGATTERYPGQVLEPAPMEFTEDLATADLRAVKVNLNEL